MHVFLPAICHFIPKSGVFLPDIYFRPGSSTLEDLALLIITDRSLSSTAYSTSQSSTIAESRTTRFYSIGR